MILRFKLNEAAFRTVIWIRPSAKYEWNEVGFQQKTAPWLSEYFPNKEAWIQAVKGGKEEQLNFNTIRQIDNTEIDLKKLSQEKVYNLEPSFQSGSKVFMPIVLRFPDGYLYLIAGNTRLALCTKYKVHPTVVMVDLDNNPGEIESDNSNLVD